METAENIWNLFKVNNKDNPCDVNDVVLVSSLLTLNRFHTLFQVSINVETRYQYMNDIWEPQRFFFFLHTPLHIPDQLAIWKRISYFSQIFS